MAFFAQALFSLRIAHGTEVMVLGSAPFDLLCFKLDGMSLYISSNKVFEMTKHLSLDRPTSEG
jgi:hypothetical protein